MPRTPAKCLASVLKDGRMLVCTKSIEHTSSGSSKRREHYDPSADERWTDIEQEN